MDQLHRYLSNACVHVGMEAFNVLAVHGRTFECRTPRTHRGWNACLVDATAMLNVKQVPTMKLSFKRLSHYQLV